MGAKQMVDFSKWLSFVLRHGAKEVGVTMDSEGFVDVTELLSKKPKYKLADLKSVVDNNNKKRFELVEYSKENKPAYKIRAVQGHTIKVANSDSRALTRNRCSKKSPILQRSRLSCMVQTTTPG